MRVIVAEMTSLQYSTGQYTRDDVRGILPPMNAGGPTLSYNPKRNRDTNRAGCGRRGSHYRFQRLQDTARHTKIWSFSHRDQGDRFPSADLAGAGALSGFRRRAGHTCKEKQKRRHRQVGIGAHVTPCGTDGARQEPIKSQQSWINTLILSKRVVLTM